MRICLYDDVTTGHHPGYIEGIVGAAVDRAMDLFVASPASPPGLPHDRWLPISSHGLRHVIHNRRQLARVARRAETLEADVLFDLYLDKNIWAVSPALRRVPRRVHVLHQTARFGGVKRPGLTARARTRLLRRRLRGIVDSGAVVVVHTRHAAEMVSSIIPGDRVVVTGYPVMSPSSIPPPFAWNGRKELRALFVGQARHEKGLDLLLTALTRTADLPLRLTVVGPQSPAEALALKQRFQGLSVRWVDRFVSRRELEEAYRGHDLVVLPYRSEFGATAGQSGPLLEALAFGRPVVVTPALVDQVPRGFPSIVVPDESPPSLEAGLREAIDNIEAMSARASVAGPAFVLAHHTYEKYVERLVEAASL